VRPKSERIKAVDGLRGILALWVVLVHLLPTIGFDPSTARFPRPLLTEYIRVQVFCIISGFVIFAMLRQHRENYITFIARRLLRIYPVYFFAFASSVALSGLSYEALQSTIFHGRTNDFRIETFENSFRLWKEHISAHLTLVHGIVPEPWLPSAPYAFLGTAWNISTEFQFYLIAPFVFWLLHDAGYWRRIFLSFLLILTWYFGLSWPNEAALSYFAVFFAVGITSYFVWVRTEQLKPFISGWTVCLMVCVLAVAHLAIGIWGLVFGSALLARARNSDGGIILHALSSRPMQFLGRISYSLYLVHLIPLYLVLYALSRTALPREAQILILFTGTFVGGILLAEFATRYVEAPFRRLRTRSVRGSRNHPMALPGTLQQAAPSPPDDDARVPAAGKTRGGSECPSTDNAGDQAGPGQETN
jgi:peptidoglycan/LPS O-acetylase OafA/YrhL